MKFKYLLVMTTYYRGEALHEIASAWETKEEAEKWAKKLDETQDNIEGFSHEFYIQEILSAGEKEKLNV